ncbi:MAG: flavin reductase family protein [Rikenellaceae bacterium]
MSNFKQISPNEISTNVIDLIGKEWMLISATDGERTNAMTASWGGVGFYSNKPVATIYVRPERYTYELIESSTHFTISVLEPGHRDALTYMGKNSGRDGDKASVCGLTPMLTPNGNPTFAEARIVLECRKIYAQMMSEDSFVDKGCYEQWYGHGHGNLHKVYMGVIESCLVKE